MRMLESPFTHGEYLSYYSDSINSDECRNIIIKDGADVIIYGHDHLQSHAYCGDKLIIDPGSCGQPLDFNPAAAYTILEIMDKGFNVTEKRVDYDIESFIKRSKKTLLYERSKTWSDLVFLALRTGRDYFGLFFKIAGQIARDKNESGSFFNNGTWEEARRVFESRYGF
jgi:hypothetical protein